MADKTVGGVDTDEGAEDVQRCSLETCSSTPPPAAVPVAPKRPPGGLATVKY